jgi:hypothetical protein
MLDDIAEIDFINVRGQVPRRIGADRGISVTRGGYDPHQSTEVGRAIFHVRVHYVGSGRCVHCPTDTDRHNENILDSE